MSPFFAVRRYHLLAPSSSGYDARIRGVRELSQGRNIVRHNKAYVPVEIEEDTLKLDIQKAKGDLHNVTIAGTDEGMNLADLQKYGKIREIIMNGEDSEGDYYIFVSGYDSDREGKPDLTVEFYKDKPPFKAGDKESAHPNQTSLERE